MYYKIDDKKYIYLNKNISVSVILKCQSLYSNVKMKVMEKKIMGIGHGNTIKIIIKNHHQY